MTDLTPATIVALRDHGEVKFESIGNGVTVASIPTGRSVESIKRLLDEYRDHPERAIGYSTVTELDSFIAWTNRFKSADSAVFCDRGNMSLRTIVNYHSKRDADGLMTPQFCDFGATYNFPMSPELHAWRKFAEAGYHGQAEFAEFLDEYIDDVLPPVLPIDGDRDITPGAEATDSDQDTPELPRFASPSTLMTFSRNISLKQERSLVECRRPGSGETTLLYEEKVVDEKGSPIRVPEQFRIGIPIFDAGPKAVLVVKLRFRIKDKAVSWSVSIHAMAVEVRSALLLAVEDVRRKTNLPVYFGTHSSR